jgi:hypothetical protein
MTKRKKGGDVYKVEEGGEIRYIQYFYSDPNYLGGDLIWVLNLKKDTTDLNEIINSGYSFYFYTIVKAGVKMGKWQFLGNLKIQEEMNYYPTFRWRNLETGLWYKLQYDKKDLLGINLNDDDLKIPIVSFQFPVGAVEFIIKGIDFFKKYTVDSDCRYFEINKKL